MQRVTVLCTAERRQEAVDALGDLGVLHLTGLEAAEGADLDKLHERHDKILRALAVLDSVPEQEPEPAPEGQPADVRKSVRLALGLAEARASAEERLRVLELEIERAEPLGEFDPELVRRLSRGGVAVNLRRATGAQVPPPPEGTILVRLGSLEGKTCFALVGPAAALKTQLPGDEIPLPEHTLGELRRSVERRLEKLQKTAAMLRGLTWQRPAMEAAAEDMAEQIKTMEVEHGMSRDGVVSHLQGFCPEPAVPDLREAAALHGWGLSFREPAAEEAVPTLIRYPRWVQPIKAAFDVLQVLPGYREADISVAFLFFFSLFFGILIGDAGYGLLFLVGTIIARFKWRKAPNYPFVLMSVLSVCTIIWGVLSGNYFGIGLSALPPVLGDLHVSWLDDQHHVMGLCFLIGAVHLTLAHTWNMILAFPSLRAGAQLGWIALVWTMFFTARTMVLQYPFPEFAYYLFGGGLTLIVLFMTPLKRLRAEWINHMMLSLSIVSCFVDVISYIRLFAVGMATVAVAQNFNQMALAAGFDSVLSGLGAALILAAGHLLNIMLCGLAILVHGVRLNTLEFSLHKEMEWSGFPYVPFEVGGLLQPPPTACGDKGSMARAHSDMGD